MDSASPPHAQAPSNSDVLYEEIILKISHGLG